MISEILLYSDNQKLLSQVLKVLSSFGPIKDLNFSSSEKVSYSTLKANQAFICMSNHEQSIIDTLDTIEPKSTAYATSSPDSTLLSRLKNVKVIGIQRHLKSTFSTDHNLNLGSIQNNISITEPVIRESELFILDLDVVRKSDVNNAVYSHPSGLFTEDISQMSRYAGMTEKNRYFILKNANIEALELIAQLIWYFAEAASIRFPDHPYFTNTVEEYAVQVTSFDTILSFYKSKSSGRWWVKIPDINENKWKSCSYEDYQLACDDNISPELLKIIATAE